MIAADSEHIGDEAIRAIKVEYEVLPAALDMIEAMKSSTPKQFTSNLDGTTIAVTAPLVRGDPTTAKADVVVDVVAKKSTEQHVALELTNSLSYWDGDKLNMTYTNQHGHGTRSGLSQALKIPQNKVRVFQTGYPEAATATAAASTCRKRTPPSSRRSPAGRSRTTTPATRTSSPARTDRSSATR